ncbi:ATP phosphoribosyltransferase regulatory subunit [Alkalicoccobacillus plakortidis]|uniref:ATP phosphoribosyltransferase regulatory subunit n=1 Tax=Alkalicoccobacillus plakortidis TaxID=444060 RepID=A0ABT0XIB5_9BACI|nr:ATP phosphoribosyltransferase regulatory subunit [Alkalicoccobacillus plakortidis]MCM2675648.1 ATP phosphoribosyltransferase regulatory subunit [Alkalicoccobacillus plakortidis]
MSKLFMFEKPLGMRDTLPELYETKKRLRTEMADEMKQWGYQMVETPTVEYYDTIGAASAILDQQLFKLMDSQGYTLVLRPDMTAPIARLVSSSLKNEAYPIRLGYHSHLFRAQQHDGGRPAEFEQVGAELIGDGTVSADAETIALMIESLKRTGLEQFKLAIGHVGFVDALLIDIVGNKERAEVLRRYLYEKNYVGFRSHVKGLQLSSIDKKRLEGLLKLRGGSDLFNDAEKLVESAQGKAALTELRELWAVLEDYGLSSFITIDLNLVLHMSYYTGTVFEVYSQELGVPLGSGGRYDELLQQFNRPAQAIGFGVRLDLLAEAIGQSAPHERRSCVIFSRERRAEAIQKARDLRTEGEIVVLQDLAGITNVDQMSEEYDEIVYVIGKSKQGGQADE